VILGLDLSLTATGWATITPDGTVETGLIPDTGSSTHIADRLWAWEIELLALFSQAPGIHHVYVEDLAGNQHGAFELGMIHATFWRAVRPFYLLDRITLVNATTLKMYATGRGNAAKALVLVEAVKRLGFDGHNHNAADALWLADMGARIHGYTRPSLPAAQLKALDKITPKAA